MKTALFFHSELCESASLVDLAPSEMAHVVKSRRLKPGQPIDLMNGQGLIAHGHIEQADRRKVTVRLITFNHHKRLANGLTIATALPKGDRQKVMLDMLTQLGCYRIIPLIYERSVTKFDDKSHTKWRRATIEACKQSQNPWLPEIGELVSVEALLESESQPVVVADAKGVGIRQHASQGQPLTVLIGPEGGFSLREYKLFETKQIPAIRLGPHILRTEAAAVSAAASWAQLFNT